MGQPQADVVLKCRACTRACKEYKSLQDEIDTGTESKTIANMLNFCFNLSFEPQAEFPSMPQHICLNCLQLLQQTYNYKRMIMDSDVLLRQRHENVDEHRSSTPNLNDNSYEDVMIELVGDGIVPQTGSPNFYEVQSEEQDDFATKYYESDEAQETLHIFDEINYYQTAEIDCWSRFSPVEDNNCIKQMDLANEKMQLLDFQVDRLSADYETEDGHALYFANDDSADGNYVVDELFETSNSPAPEDNVFEYVCNICNKSFRQQCRLNQHKRVHNNLKIHSCHVCGKKLKHLRNFKLHLQRHANHKPHQCQICPKFFRTSARLEMHMRRHVHPKPYKCKECEHCFADQDHLTRHKRTHTGVRPYACTVCDKAYYESTTLRQHMVRHSVEKPYKCELCGVGLSHKAGYKKHMMVHSGVKPHVCHICGHSFTFVSNLNAHQRMHSRAKSFECDKCSRTFPTKRGLQLHVRVHNNN